jgi:hypothetical protein
MTALSFGGVGPRSCDGRSVLRPYERKNIKIPTLNDEGWGTHAQQTPNKEGCPLRRINDEGWACLTADKAPTHNNQRA